MVLFFLSFFLYLFVYLFIYLFLLPTPLSVVFRVIHARALDDSFISSREFFSFYITLNIGPFYSFLCTVILHYRYMECSTGLLERFFRVHCKK